MKINFIHLLTASLIIVSCTNNDKEKQSTSRGDDQKPDIENVDAPLTDSTEVTKNVTDRDFSVFKLSWPTAVMSEPLL